MTEGRPKQATEENWMVPPDEGWTVDQVKDLDLPFDWELVDGGIVPRGQTKWWHDRVRDRLRDHLTEAAPKGIEVTVERCVMLDNHTAVKPDVVVHDISGLNLFEVECTPASTVRLAIEVVSPGSRSEDRVRKPFLYAKAGVPCYWRVELDRDNRLAVHEYWLNIDTKAYQPPPMHPIHWERIKTDAPYAVDIDVRALTEL